MVSLLEIFNKYVHNMLKIDNLFLAYFFLKFLKVDNKDYKIH